MPRRVLAPLEQLVAQRLVHATLAFQVVWACADGKHETTLEPYDSVEHLEALADFFKSVHYTKRPWRIAT